MLNTGSVAIGLAVFLALAPALARDASTARYSCGNSAGGAYGRVWVSFYVNENGKFSESMGAWEVATPYTPIEESPGTASLRRNTELTLHFETDKTPLKPLRPARLYVRQLVSPLPPQATYLYLTLADGRYARALHISPSQMQEWRNSKWIGFGSGVDVDDPVFLDAFIRSPALAIDVIRIDGVPVSHTVLYMKDGTSELQRLHAQAIAASKNYRSACALVSDQMIEY